MVYVDKKIKTLERTEYSEECNLCDKIIKGLSENQVRYNMEVHKKQKHSEDKDKEVQ